MKIKEVIRLTGILSACCVLLFFSACRANVKYIKRMQSLEEGVSHPQTEEEITVAIQKYRQRVEDIMAAENQIGIWYKILGVRYLDNRMYGKALDCFQESVRYHPDNQNLYYYVGICAGYMAKAELDYNASGSTAKRASYLALAESAYKRSLELEPGFVRSLYALAVLYVFELNRPGEAVPLLQRLLTIDTGHTDALFVLARAYYMLYDYQAAADTYERIIKTPKDKVKIGEAEANKKTVLDALYASPE